MSIKLEIEAKDPAELKSIINSITINTDENTTVELPTEPVELPPATPEPVEASVSEPVEINGLEVDSAGIPWDIRIHASTKTKKADGTWKLKKRPKEFPDVNNWNNYISGVVNELNGITPEPVQAPVTESVQETPSEVFTAQPPISEPVQTQANIPTDMGSFLQFVTENGTKITVPEVTAICQKHGVNSLMEIADHLDLLPILHAEIQGVINERS